MMKMMKWAEAEEINVQAIRELRKLATKGEGINLEFKRKASYPDKIVSEMVAFANTQGGILLIGVSDDGTIPGVKFPEEEIFALERALEKHARPQLKITHHVIPLGKQRYVVQFNIAEGKRKPYACIEAGGKKKVYVRYEDKSVQASREMTEIIRRHKTTKSIRLRYGEYEAMLMKYLDLHPYITFDQYRLLTGMNRYKASRSLVILVLANILQIIPTEKGDHYKLHQSFHLSHQDIK